MVIIYFSFPNSMSPVSFFCVFMKDLKVALLSTFLGGWRLATTDLALFWALSSSSFCFYSSSGISAGMNTNTRASSRVTDWSLGVNSLSTGVQIFINFGFLLSMISPRPRIRLVATWLPMLKKSGSIARTKCCSTSRENSCNATILDLHPFSIITEQVAGTMILLAALEVANFARLTINYLWKVVFESTVGRTFSISSSQLPSNFWGLILPLVKSSDR